MQNISYRIKLLLTSKGITQKEFAHETGLTEAAISRYMQGNRLPSATGLIQIADATGVSPTWLLGYGSDDKIEFLK